MNGNYVKIKIRLNYYYILLIYVKILHKKLKIMFHVEQLRNNKPGGRPPGLLRKSHPKGYKGKPI